MEKVFICGHKNPDTDSVASAASYAYLKSQINKDYEFVPIRCGTVNDQTKFIFQKAEMPLPEYMKDIYPKVIDSMTTRLITAEENDPLSKFLRILREKNLRFMPVINKDNEYEGMLGVNDVTELFLRDDRESKPVFSLRADSLRRSLRGTVLNVGEKEEFSASVVVATMAYDDFNQHVANVANEENTLLITGNRQNILHDAFKKKYPAIIIVGLSEEACKKLDFGDYKGWVFYSPFDSSQTIRCVEMATPIGKLLKKVEPCSPYDYIDSVADAISKSSTKSLPVVSDGKLIGVITGTDILKRKRAKLIMMDHNEATQAIDGAETADLMEIIDHHRLGTIKTSSPVTFFAKPVGSTCTLVYQLYKANKVEIPKKIAMLLLGGMLSDTVIMKSPTTTQDDIDAINDLSSICGLDAKEYGVEIFSATDSLTSRSAKDIIGTDFKIFEEYGVRFGISQAETVTLAQLGEVEGKLREELFNVKENNKLDWMMLLVTDIIKEESQLITTGFAPAEQIFAYKKLGDNLYFLPGVLSRKKQLLPEISRILEEISK
ncbi:MAG: putative manganese-dependent inorganic diphosphatase [Mucispirillum sp.]|uniref:inorganic diphosphatase n=1 Tax=Candidatus Mucispirillum faecigallinarum TaxID=2838699 RepID=A0A9D2GTK3_9BACT|nr:putative manganese-dependent inorganic diphosphatase [Mucispirillum sp.]HIZ89793.1 putative manganese-dependent inorganic diphosphatase [Candidatus Mucispirillum faecigallinarum]